MSRRWRSIAVLLGLIGLPVGGCLLWGAWLVRGPQGTCLLFRGISRQSVNQACGARSAIDWEPPDDRGLSLRDAFDYWDIDAALCPGAAHRYGERIVVYSWDGELAAVQDAGDDVAAPPVTAAALQYCGPVAVLTEVSRLDATSDARARLESIAADAESHARIFAQEALARWPALVERRSR